MTTISPPLDPTAYLTTPSAHGSGALIWKTRLACGPVIGGVDAFITAVSGLSPLEEWVMKPFAGDWDAFDRATEAWSQVGQAVDAVGKNIDALPGMTSEDLWSGEARQAWTAANAKVAQVIEPLPEACSAMSQYAEALGEMARSIIEFVLETLRWIAETALRIIAELAVIGVGEVAAAAETAVLAYRVVSAGRRIMNFITKFKKLTDKILLVIDIVNGALANLSRVSQALATVDTASRTALAATSAR